MTEKIKLYLTYALIATTISTISIEMRQNQMIQNQLEQLEQLRHGLDNIQSNYEQVVDRISTLDDLKKLCKQPKPRHIKVKVTFYTNQDNALEGGAFDRRGKLLTDHNYPVVAMPKDVPYGSVLVLNGIPFTVVDTGSAMIWTDTDTCNVDIFVAGKTSEWLNKYTGVFYADAFLYEKR